MQLEIQLKCKFQQAYFNWQCCLSVSFSVWLDSFIKGQHVPVLGTNRTHLLPLPISVKVITVIEGL